MLFHTWPFLLFMLVVLPVFYALGRTRWWVPWLLAASYFFYGWWNPYYLLLVFYSTALDYLLVAFMDHSPAPPTAGPRSWSLPQDRILRAAFFVSGLLAMALAAAAIAGPAKLRPTFLAFGTLVFL